MPRDIHSDLRAAVPGEDLNDVVRAFVAAGRALEEDDVDRALELLLWAKAVAPRSVMVREALGLVLYNLGEFASAHSELVTYRRLSGRQDQNHVLADCARAAGRHDKVAEYVAEMVKADVVPERKVEGLIVQAGDRADRGDLRGALAVLGRAGLDPEGEVRGWHPRLWYVAADLNERMGDLDAARDYLEAISAVEPDFLDVEERLAALDA